MSAARASASSTSAIDAICLVTEPYYRSLETVRRMAALVVATVGAADT